MTQTQVDEGLRWLTAPTAVRAEDGEGRTVEGVVVPYGQEWATGTGYVEVFAPGAFREDAARWNAREDGARVPFVSGHEPGPRVFLGPVVELTDTPEGLRFRAELLDTPEAAAYLAQVRAGANGVSAEFAPIGRPQQSRGRTIHRRARIAAIAGALTPAYDGARVFARSEEGIETMGTHETEPEQPQGPTEPEQPQGPTEPEAPEPSQLQVRSAELEAMRATAGPARITRAELVYGPGSPNRFLSDVVLSARGDMAASERQARHYAQLDEVAALMTRAGDVLSTEVPGTIPPEYLPGLLVSRDLKGRPMGGFFDRIAITDARPRTFAKVTTSTAVTVQSAEGTNVALSDFATTPETAQPLIYSGHTKVSRQVLDSSDPAAESMILADLIEAYAQTSETVIVTATEAAAEAGTAAIAAATPHDGTLGAIVEYQGDRFSPAQAVFGPASWYAALLTQKATGGNALVPFLTPTNSQGEMQAGAAGAALAGVPLILSWASGAAVVTVARRSDMVVYESAIARFSYEQVDGPAAIRLGIWAYLAVADRKGARKHTIA